MRSKSLVTKLKLQIKILSRLAYGDLLGGRNGFLLALAILRPNLHKENLSLVEGPPSQSSQL